MTQIDLEKLKNDIMPIGGFIEWDRKTDSVFVNADRFFRLNDAARAYLASQATPTDEYTQGVCHDGAAILKNGVAMTVDEIVATLNGPAKVEVQASEAQTREALEWFNDILGYALKGWKDDPASAKFVPVLIAALQRPSVNDDTLLREAYRVIQILNPNLDPPDAKGIQEFYAIIAKLKERLDK